MAAPPLTEDHGLELVEGLSERFGSIHSLTGWRLGNGEAVFVVVFERATRTEPVPRSGAIALSLMRGTQYRYTVVALAPAPEVRPLWALDLGGLYAPGHELDHLELDTVGLLYDPSRASVLWRAGPLVSRDAFAVVGDLVVSGHGFTDEPDHLFALDRETGVERGRLRLRTAPFDISVVGDELHVRTHGSNLVIAIERRAPDSAPP